MKLEPWEPDLRTLLARIDEKELDLQPEFQRGLAWSSSKQQRLIDTVLRGWAIPPLHLLVLENHYMAVLDGQQRLRALQLFMHDQLRVGRFEPHDVETSNFHGSRYTQLPPDVRRRIANYKIPCYRLYDYAPEEPYELFFRLNLPTGLTQAEKRNALFGPSRAQVKELVAQAQGSGWNTELLGFANARLAYDDIIARACVCVERRSLRVPLTAGNIETYYRSPAGFSAETLKVVHEATLVIAETLRDIDGAVRLNKATLLTWLLVAARAHLHRYRLELRDPMMWIEASRGVTRGRAFGSLPKQIEARQAINGYLELYNDRASLRVTDVLSVVARDAIVWRLMSLVGTSPHAHEFHDLFRDLARAESEPESMQVTVLEILESPNSWGSLT